MVRVKVNNRVLSQSLKKLAHCLVGCWDPKPGRGDDLRNWGTQMAKLWGLKGNLGLAKLENGKALLEFKVMTEAEKALKVGEVSVGGFVMRLEKWSQMTGCLMEGERERERGLGENSWITHFFMGSGYPEQDRGGVWGGFGHRR